MTERYHIGPVQSSIECQKNIVGTSASEDRELVNSVISRQGNVLGFELFPVSVRIKRDYRKYVKKPLNIPVRAEINSFSSSSKRRLRFIAVNAFPGLVSQFAMTYHERLVDGYQLKIDLDNFLRSLRREYRQIGYLWILEFQRRHFPHLHLFLTSPVTSKLHSFLASSWHRIAEPDSRSHLNFHLHDKNFIPWEMRTGSYLCKYLDKERQKMVPSGFFGVGRFWGSSRGLVPKSEFVIANEVKDSYTHISPEQITGEVLSVCDVNFIVRSMCRHREKQLRGKWKKAGRQSHMSYTLPAGRVIYKQVEQYLKKKGDY